MTWTSPLWRLLSRGYLTLQLAIKTCTYIRSFSSGWRRPCDGWRYYLSIRLEHINFQRRTIYIPEAKVGPREQPITRHLAQVLTGYVAAAEPGQEWLFPAPRSQTGHTVNIEKSFRRVVSAAGLDVNQVVHHTLRHTAITHLVQAGVDLPTVQGISGHKTLQMVVRYSHQNGEHIQAAIDMLDQRYRSVN
jgi:integrase